MEIDADQIGGEGAHRYTLVCLVSLQDPGLTVFDLVGPLQVFSEIGRASCRERVSSPV